MDMQSIKKFVQLILKIGNKGLTLTFDTDEIHQAVNILKEASKQDGNIDSL